ncbi:hypothetical protein BS78_07G230800 [Paspalum vaginatum]|nr:hypothetical protein BS78_07G230800 [Paspalum vaginatum]
MMACRVLTTRPAYRVGGDASFNFLGSVSRTLKIVMDGSNTMQEEDGGPPSHRLARVEPSPAQQIQKPSAPTQLPPPTRRLAAPPIAATKRRLRLPPAPWLLVVAAPQRCVVRSGLRPAAPAPCTAQRPAGSPTPAPSVAGPCSSLRTPVLPSVQAPRMAPWSDLPPELLSLVFLHLPTRADRAFFPAVCRTWCSAARQSRLPLPSPVPWLVHPSSGTVNSLPPGGTFRFPDGVCYHTSCGEWFVLTRDDSSCFLMNPFTTATLPLPSLSSYSYYEHPVEFGDDMDPDFDGEDTWLHIKDRDKICVLSLVVCSPRLIAAIVAVRYLGAIALCRPGAASWSVSARDECRYLSHMVFFQGKLYALDDADPDRTEDLIRIDIVDEHGSDVPRVSRIERFIQGACYQCQDDDDDCMNYLLESHGSLLMVCREVHYKIDHYGHRVGSSEFEVLKANLEQHMWTNLRTLGNDQALFLGQGCSKTVCVSPYDLSRDCIFFLDDYPYNDWYYWSEKYDDSIISGGVYDMKDKKTYPPLPMASWKDGKGPPATWIFWQGSTRGEGCVR